jgi:hypothetical protein
VIFILPSAPCASRVVILVMMKEMKLSKRKTNSILTFSVKGDNVRGIIETVELKGNKPQSLCLELQEVFRKNYLNEIQKF